MDTILRPLKNSKCSPFIALTRAIKNNTGNISRLAPDIDISSNNWYGFIQIQLREELDEKSRV